MGGPRHTPGSFPPHLASLKCSVDREQVAAALCVISVFSVLLFRLAPGM
jgi:hypothetical protein